MDILEKLDTFLTEFTGRPAGRTGPRTPEQIKRERKRKRMMQRSSGGSKPVHTGARKRPFRR